MTELLNQLSDQQYAEPSPVLSGATIGGHYRHIIELFLSLLDHYEDGVVNYDRRERDCRIETKTDFALHKIDHIKDNLVKEDKTILLEQSLNEKRLVIKSNYYRELLYNLEHAIHHQALIKIALLRYDSVQISRNFGVAHSTIAYRQQCAQ